MPLPHICGAIIWLKHNSFLWQNKYKWKTRIQWRSSLTTGSIVVPIASSHTEILNSSCSASSVACFILRDFSYFNYIQWDLFILNRRIVVWHSATGSQAQRQCYSFPVCVFKLSHWFYHCVPKRAQVHRGLEYEVVFVTFVSMSLYRNLNQSALVRFFRLTVICRTYFASMNYNSFLGCTTGHIFILCVK